MNTALVDANGRSVEERKALQEKVDRLNKEAQDNWENPTWRHEMAQQLTETIRFGFEHENLLGLMSTVENVAENARVYIKETRGLRAFWMARGGFIEQSTLRTDVMEIPRDQIGFHVEESEEKLRFNFAETQSDLISSAIQRMDAEINLRVLSMFQLAVPVGHASYSSTSGFSLASLNAAMRRVRDASLDQGPITIIGRATMTDQIIDALTTGNYSAFLPQTNEDLLTRGVLGTYRGARIVTLKNYQDDENVSFFPANELYVVARDASKFAFWGGLQSKEYVEPNNWYWHYLAKRDFGGSVYRQDRLARVVDTSQAA